MVSVDAGPTWIQRATNPGIGRTNFSTSTTSEDVGHRKPSRVLGELHSRAREVGLLYRKDPDENVRQLHGVLIVRSLVPNGLEKHLLTIHLTANCNRGGGGGGGGVHRPECKRIHNNGQWKGGSVGWEVGAWTQAAKGLWEGGKGKRGTQAKQERIGSVELRPQGVSQDGEGA